MSRATLALTAVVSLAVGAAGAYFGAPILFPPAPPAATEAPPAPAPEAAPEAAPAPEAAANGRVQRGQLVMEGIPEIPDSVVEDLRKYQNARSAAFQGWAPDGDIIISTRFGETAQLHRIETPMGARQQMTFFAEPVAGGGYPRTADAKGYIYVRDTGGDEYFQIYYVDDATGKETRLSEPGTRNTGLAWSDDGKLLAWSVATADSPVYKIVTLDMTTIASGAINRKVVLEREGAWAPIDVSGDNTKLLIDNSVSVSKSSLWVLDLATGAMTEINPTDKNVAYAGASFAPDGTGIIAASNEAGEFQVLTRYGFDGSVTPLTADINWDVEQFDISPDGSLIAFAVNDNGMSKVYLRRLSDNSDVAIPALPIGILGGMSFNADGSRIGLTLNTPSSPGDVWSIELGANTLTRWTRSEIGGLNPDTFIEPTLITYPTFDQVDGAPRQIPAFYYRPRIDGKLPVIIYIHGGPESQDRPGFSTTFQYWTTQLGIAVISPNVRGSTGYGKSYVELDNGVMREDSVKDIGALLDWIATQPDLDASRVMVYGGSYGGYMVYAALTNYNDRLAGGVSIVGISNFVTFLENTAGYRRDLRRVEYGDERDPAVREVLMNISPLTNASRITRPLFVIQGANDPRVPASEAEQMVAAVRTNGGDPWYLLALDEGHGFAKKSNRDFMGQAVAMFLKQRLLGEAP